MKVKQLQEMMKHAQAMQNEIESKMNELRFEGTAGGAGPHCDGREKES